MNKKSKFSGLLSQAIEQKNNQEVNVKDNINISPELKALIPPLSEEEYNLLENSLITESCREAIILWENKDKFTVIDGHNRYEICKKYHLDFKFQVKEFENIAKVKEWMIANQLGKRNLTELQKSYLRGLQYKNEKQKTFNISNLKPFAQVGKLSTSTEQQKTIEKLGEFHQVSPKTIQRDEKFAVGLDSLTGADTTLKNKILVKEINIPRKVIQDFALVEKDNFEEMKRDIEEQYILGKKKAKQKTEEKTITTISPSKTEVLSIINNMQEDTLDKLLLYLKRNKKWLY